MRHIASAVAAALCVLPYVTSAHQAVDKRILQLVPDRPADDVRLPNGQIDPPGQIRRGRELFLNGTFGGNGRTCGTCHEPTRNFALDPEFIATLPQSSPLFVAENNPNLRALENPDLMRRFALILENLDGFDNPGVMRGVPHTLALRRSIAPAEPPFPLVNALGWSGDGSPGDGSLRQFAVGAVVQHFTKDLRRRPGIDFRLPSKQQLAQMERFQLSLGRQSDISLDGDPSPALVFRDQNVEAGKVLFVNGVTGRAGNNRSCNGCHNDGGALDAAGNNRQRATGAAMLPTAPACRGVAPGDGGFGQTPVFSATICMPAITAVFRGDQTMNTPPVVESADTGPWFHNNAIEGQIENAVAFYTTDTFNASPAGAGNAFVLSTAQVNQIGALLRALNARENVRNAIVVTTRAVNEPKARGDASIREALSEVRDALGVLQQAPVPLYAGTNIVTLLGQAATLQTQAIGQNGGTRKTSLNTAIARLRQVQPQFTQ